MIDRNTLPSYPFPILPQFDPSSTTTTTATTATFSETTKSTVTSTTINPGDLPAVTIPGLDGVAIPASSEALLFYISSMTEQIR